MDWLVVRHTGPESLGDYHRTEPSSLLIIRWPSNKNDLAVLQHMFASLVDLVVFAAPDDCPPVDSYGASLGHLTALEIVERSVVTDQLASVLSWLPSLQHLRRLTFPWTVDLGPMALANVARHCKLIQSITIDRDELGLPLWLATAPQITSARDSLEKMTSLQEISFWQEFEEILLLTDAVLRDSLPNVEVAWKSLADCMPPQLASLERVFVLTRYGEEQLCGSIPAAGFFLRAANSPSLCQFFLSRVNATSQFELGGDTALSYLLVSRKVGNREMEELAAPEGVSTSAKIELLLDHGADPFQLIMMPRLMPRALRERHLDISMGNVFHLAALWGDPWATQALLAGVNWSNHGAKYHFLDSCGYTPLHYFPKYAATWHQMYGRFLCEGGLSDFLLHADNPTEEPPLLCFLSSSQRDRTVLVPEFELAEFLLGVLKLCPAAAAARRRDGSSFLASILDTFDSIDSLLVELVEMTLAAERLKFGQEKLGAADLELYTDDHILAGRRLYMAYVVSKEDLFAKILLPASSMLARNVCLHEWVAAHVTIVESPPIVSVVDEFISYGVDLNWFEPDTVADRPILSLIPSTESGRHQAWELVQRGADPTLGPENTKFFSKLSLGILPSPDVLESDKEAILGVMRHLLERGCTQDAIVGVSAVCRLVVSSVGNGPWLICNMLRHVTPSSIAFLALECFSMLFSSESVLSSLSSLDDQLKLKALAVLVGPWNRDAKIPYDRLLNIVQSLSMTVDRPWWSSMDGIPLLISSSLNVGCFAANKQQITASEWIIAHLTTYTAYKEVASGPFFDAFRARKVLLQSSDWHPQQAPIAFAPSGIRISVCRGGSSRQRYLASDCKCV